MRDDTPAEGVPEVADIVIADRYQEDAEAYALGALDAAETASFEAHLASGCASCTAAAQAARQAGAGLGDASWAPVASPSVRQQILDLAAAPPLPIDPAAYSWDEPVPGVRLHLLREDAERQMKGYLVWADPGARHPRHRHLGPELILILAGGLRDHRGTYLAGDICRSDAGSEHAEEVIPGETCFCYVVYYGGLEMLEPPPA